MPGEDIIEVPLWFYNVHEGVTYLNSASSRTTRSSG